MKDIEIIEKLKTIVTPYTQNKEGLNHFDHSTDFIKDLEVNSANLVDIVLDVEDEFNIEIDNESMDGMMKVGDAVETIRKKQSER